MIYQRVCKCGKEFVTSYPRKKYCSEDCRLKLYKEKLGKVKLSKKNCKLCEKEFMQRASNQIYCSMECKKKAFEGKYKYVREKPQIKKYICHYCGKEFESERKKMYCSIKCRSKANSPYARKDEFELTTLLKPIHKKTLSEVARLATEAGLTYGQYVMRYGGKLNEM